MPKSSSKKSKSSSTSSSTKFKKMSDKNMVKIIKDLDISPIYVMLIINLIVIAYISGIIHYLNKLQSCDCYKDKNDENYSNLTYMVIIEAIILTLYIISTLVIIISLFAIKDIKQSGAGKKGMTTYLIVTLILNLIITGYFVYNVYKLSENIDPACDCTKDWLRYLLYIQAFVMGIGIIGNLIVLGRTLLM